jgi:hypothetical protein
MNVLSFYSSALFMNAAAGKVDSYDEFIPIWTKIKWFNFCQRSPDATTGPFLTVSQAMGSPISSSLCQPTGTSTLAAADSSCSSLWEE